MKFTRFLFYFSIVFFFISGTAVFASQEKRSVEGLIYDLSSPEAKNRLIAAATLGENRIREAIPKLITMTNDQDPDVRYEVVKALVYINDTRSLAAFIDFTRDDQERVQKRAVAGLVNVYAGQNGGFTQGMKDAFDFLNPLDDGFNSLVVEPYIKVSPKAVSSIENLLFAPGKALRKDSAVALGILRARDATPAIMQALPGESDNGVKVELIRALYKIGDTSSGSAIIPFIKDTDKEIHDTAILTAGQLRLKDAVPNLNEIYRLGTEERRTALGFIPVSGTDDLQKKVLRSLALIGDRRSQDIFEDALEDKRSQYRQYGAEGLGRIGDPAFTTLLAKKFLLEKDGSARLALSFALYNLGREDHIVALVDEVKGDQAYSYLMELPTEKINQLYPYARSKDNGRKAELLKIIGLRGDKDAHKFIRDFTNHENSGVASAANLATRNLNSRFNR
jgi:HEAT repeat protein